jgi:hypothetical protein
VHECNDVYICMLTMPRAPSIRQPYQTSSGCLTAKTCL